MPQAGLIRVFAVDDHPVLRAGLRALLETQSDMQMVGEASCEQEAIERGAALQPDITLMDLRLSDVSGTKLARQVQVACPKTRVIMFTSHSKEDEIYEALKGGAWAYIPKGAPSSELLRGIRIVHSGQRYIPPDIGRMIVGHLSAEGLTPREREVFQELSDGHSNREIATTLQISEHTVGLHLRNVMGKLGATRRTQAIAIGLRRGILRVD